MSVVWDLSCTFCHCHKSAFESDAEASFYSLISIVSAVRWSHCHMICWRCVAFMAHHWRADPFHYVTDVPQFFSKPEFNVSLCLSPNLMVISRQPIKWTNKICWKWKKESYQKIIYMFPVWMQLLLIKLFALDLLPWLCPTLCLAWRSGLMWMATPSSLV